MTTWASSGHTVAAWGGHRFFLRHAAMPRIPCWSGDDPVAYILSVNVHRRHIPKGTQAMALAIAHPEPVKIQGKREKGKSLSVSKIDNDVSNSMLSHARTVIKEFGVDSEQVAFVMRGGSLAAWNSAACLTSS